MNKTDLEKIFKKLGIPYNEGIQNMDKNQASPRLVFFEYVWTPITSSGSRYNTSVTYQISFFSLDSRNSKLIELRNILAENNINPVIYHEYLKEKREWHSYFSIEVLEDVC